MKLAICDDELTAREQIAGLVDCYSSEKKAVEYELFKDYSELERRIDEFDIFFLDYLMKGVDGLEFARLLRSRYGSKKIIIFITQYNEIVYDTFEVQTHRFLKKPIEKVKLFEALDSALETITGSKMLFQYDGVTTSLELDEIFFFEIRHKELYVCTENEQYLCRKPISAVESELEGKGFYRIHRSYLVNMKNIRTFNSSQAEFTNGESIPISDRKYSDFCKAYLKMK